MRLHNSHLRSAAAALLVLVSGAAQAGLIITTPTAAAWSGYNGQPVLQTGVLSAGYSGTLVSSPSSSSLEFVYLGEESGHVNRFQFIVGPQSLTEGNAVGDSIAGVVPMGVVGFRFQDTNTAYVATNGGANGIVGIRFVPNVTTTSLGFFDYVIGFNDNGSTDGDYDDFVVGVRVIPEPAPLALLGLGFAGLAFSRRKKA